MEGRKRSKGVNTYRGIDVKFAFSRIVIPFGGGSRNVYKSSHKRFHGEEELHGWLRAGCLDSGGLRKGRISSLTSRQ